MPDKDGNPVEPVCPTCHAEAGDHHYWCPVGEVKRREKK